MNILVTGATGFIASHTIVELQNENHTIIGIDNLCNSSVDTLDNIEKIAVVRRERKLTKTGLQKLLSVIKKEKDINLRSAFLMLIYGFAPKTKIFKMRWDDLDFNHDMWGDMPLSGRAVILLQDLPQDGEWVFMGRGRFHLTDPRVAWKRIVSSANMSYVTMDDVHKFLMHALVWNPDKDNLRNNMNDLLDELFA